MLRFFLVVSMLGAAALVEAGEPAQLMTTDEALALPRPAPDKVISYGSDALQFGELRVPDGDGPFPVVMVIHGGCWLAAYDLGYISGLADRLTGAGLATWSIEYRRVGDPGGGWPGTFADVGAAADALRRVGPKHRLDLDRVVVLGHSAGGHLALWLAARPMLDPSDPLRGDDPLRFRGVVALAGITDLAAYSSTEGCGSAVPGLLGGNPHDHPERLGRSSPVEMPRSGVSEVLVIGDRDPIVPRSQAERYVEKRGGADVQVVEIEDAGHFELIDPAHRSWSSILRAVLTTLDIASRAEDR